MKTIFSILVRPVNRARILALEWTPRPYLSAISERSVESGLERYGSFDQPREFLDNGLYLG